jgi:hypothetical protein
MLINIPSAGSTPDYKQYAAWLITAFVMALGFRYAKDIAAFVFEKLYEVFIQHKTFL